MEKRTYRVLRGEFTQHDDEGKAHVFREGDTIELDVEDAAKRGDAVELIATSAPATPSRIADEDGDI